MFSPDDEFCYYHNSTGCTGGYSYLILSVFIDVKITNNISINTVR